MYCRFTGRITLNYKLEAETFKGRKVSRVFFKGSGTNVIDGSIQLNEQTSPSAMNDEHLVFFTVSDFKHLTLTLINYLFLFFIHLKLELLTQFPASNNENKLYL